MASARNIAEALFADLLVGEVAVHEVASVLRARCRKHKVPPAPVEEVLAEMLRLQVRRMQHEEREAIVLYLRTAPLPGSLRGASGSPCV